MQKLLNVFSSRKGRGRQDAPLEVTGVCDLLGPSIRQYGAGEPYRAHATLIAWRMAGGEIETGELQLAQELPPSGEANDKFVSKFAPGQLVRATLTAPPRPLASWQSADILAVLSAEPDPELQSKAADLLSPPPIEHPILGQFIHHPRLVWEYYGEGLWGGEKVSVVLQGRGPFPDFPSLREKADLAARIFDHEASLAASLKEVLRESAFTEWKEQWQTDEQLSLSADDYAERLKVVGIYPFEGEMFEFELDGGDLHDGRFIMASGTLSDGFEDAGVP